MIISGRILIIPPSSSNAALTAANSYSIYSIVQIESRRIGQPGDFVLYQWRISYTVAIETRGWRSCLFNSPGIDRRFTVPHLPVNQASA
jgi:hypothetical protein